MPSWVLPQRQPKSEVMFQTLIGRTQRLPSRSPWPWRRPCAWRRGWPAAAPRRGPGARRCRIDASWRRWARSETIASSAACSVRAIAVWLPLRSSVRGVASAVTVAPVAVTTSARGRQGGQHEARAERSGQTCTTGLDAVASAVVTSSVRRRTHAGMTSGGVGGAAPPYRDHSVTTQTPPEICGRVCSGKPACPWIPARHRVEPVTHLTGQQRAGTGHSSRASGVTPDVTVLPCGVEVGQGRRDAVHDLAEHRQGEVAGPVQPDVARAQVGVAQAPRCAGGGSPSRCPTSRR